MVISKKSANLITLGVTSLFVLSVFQNCAPARYQEEAELPPVLNIDEESLMLDGKAIGDVFTRGQERYQLLLLTEDANELKFKYVPRVTTNTSAVTVESRDELTPPVNRTSQIPLKVNLQRLTIERVAPEGADYLYPPVQLSRRTIFHLDNALIGKAICLIQRASSEKVACTMSYSEGFAELVQKLGKSENSVSVGSRPSGCSYVSYCAPATRVENERLLKIAIQSAEQDYVEGSSK